MRNLMAAFIGFAVFMVLVAGALNHAGHDVSGDLLLGMLPVAVFVGAPIGIQVGGK